MVNTRKEVHAFVRRHDINPRNRKAERIDASKVTPALAESYGRQVLASLSRNNLSAFHRANELLFKYLPPSKRGTYLKWLEKSCSRWSDSALCKASRWDYVPKRPPDGCSISKTLNRCVNDQRTYRIYSQVRNLHAIPSITEKSYPHLYAKIKWFIKTAAECGETELAQSLDESLAQGRLRYLPDLKMAMAYVDQREFGTIVFGKKSFEGTWEDEIRGVDGNRLIISDKDILQYAENTIEGFFSRDFLKAQGIYGKLTMQDLDELGKTMTFLRPDKIRAKMVRSTLARQKERYRYYYGNISTKTFHKEMPNWIITLAHEGRHLSQIKQDGNSWKPEYAKRTRPRGSAYYTSLIRLSSTTKYNQPHHAMTMGRMATLGREAKVAKRMTAITSVRERDAGLSSIRIAKKIHHAWLRQKKLNESMAQLMDPKIPAWKRLIAADRLGEMGTYAKQAALVLREAKRYDIDPAVRDAATYALEQVISQEK